MALYYEIIFERCLFRPFVHPRVPALIVFLRGVKRAREDRKHSAPSKRQIEFVWKGPKQKNTHTYTRAHTHMRTQENNKKKSLKVEAPKRLSRLSFDFNGAFRTAIIFSQLNFDPSHIPE